MYIDAPQPIQAAPDLTKPSLAGLSYLLRHHELWPEGFEWNWCGVSSCGIGLARRKWGHAWGVGVVGYWRSIQLFCLTKRGVSSWHMKPEHVADKIDAYLARH